MNLETVCLICLKRGTGLKDIFTWNETVMDKIYQLSSMISACISLPLTETAAFPQTMCQDCIKNLLIAYKFRLQCENAYKYFTEIYPTLSELDEIKIENNSDDLKSKDNFDQLFEKNKEKLEVKLEASLDVFEDKKLDLNSLIKDDDETYDDFCLYPEQTYSEKPKKSKKKKAGESKKVKSKHGSKKRTQFIEKQIREGSKLDIKNEWPCTICIKTFRYQHSLLRHLDCHYALKSFYCEKCKKYYRNEKNHMAMHRRGAKFKCEVCNRGCKSKSMLEKHLEIHSTEREKFICDVESCKKIFLTVQGATRHKLIHSGAKEFLCHFCSKAFAEKSGLELHIRRHLNIKQYQCRMCPKMFLTSSHRIQHERRHTNTRNYSCQYCEKLFFTGSNLRRHVLSHTKEQNHNCRFCPKKFSRRDNKRRHEMVMHGVSDEADLPAAQS